MSEPQFTSWLSNRLDEVEALASGAESLAKSPWRADGGRIEHSGGDVDRDREKFLWDSQSCTEDWQPLCMRHGVAQFVAAFDPAMVLRLVAATRQLLELHERWELEEYEYTGNPIVRIEDGVTYQHWPAGSITGQRQVGVRYACWHCINSDESHMDWPCPTLRAVAVGWGWVE